MCEPWSNALSPYWISEFFEFKNLFGKSRAYSYIFVAAANLFLSLLIKVRILNVWKLLNDD